MKRTTLALIVSWIVSCSLSLFGLGCGGDEGAKTPDGGRAGASAAAGTTGGEAGSDGAGVGASAGSAAGDASSSVDASHVDDAGAASDAATSDGGEAIEGAKVFYFGHSLVGHHLPQMLRSFASARGNTYEVSGQVGWGTPIMSHWRWEGSFDSGFVPLGFAEELPGSTLFSVDGHTALESGEYDVIVLTETNGFASGSPGNWSSWCDPGAEFGGCSIEMATNLVRKARMHNGAMRAFLYSNWKSLNDFGGSVSAWANDVEAMVGYWENLADETEAQLASEGATDAVVAVIPGGPIFARVVLEAEAGNLAAFGIADESALFLDDVHTTHLGFYVIALAHYASIFRESPVGLPNKVDIVASGHGAIDEGGFEVDAALAAHLQAIVLEELSSYPRSGAGL